MNQQLFLEMIDAAINGKTIDLSEVDEEFIKVAKEQTFLPFLYVASKDKKYKKYYIQSVLIHERINEVGKLIDDILNEAKIPHIFLKGYELQNLYPDPNLRMMGDIDVLVNQNDFKQVCFILKENKFSENGSTGHDKTFSIKNIKVEIHFLLMSKNEFGDKFFTKKIQEFNNEYYFVYIVAHYAKHFSKGAGIREIIDIYLLLKNYNYDFNIINNYLNQLNLEKFYYLLEDEMNFIFNNKIKIKNMKNCEYALQCSLKFGIHGFGTQSNFYSNLLSSNKKYTKTRILFKRLFIERKELISIYPWAKFFPLIPFAYLFRFFFLLFNKKKNLKDLYKSKKEDKFVQLLDDLDILKNI